MMAPALSPDAKKVLRDDQPDMAALQYICKDRPMMMRFVIPLCLTALPVLAETTMSAAEFDAYTRGKTLYFGADGQAYGVERYLDNQRVVWSFLDGKCQDGVWYEEAGQICFVYENRLDPQCWTFSEGPTGLIARFENDPLATKLYEAQDIDEDMLCLGPEVGV